jgi:hypothetical protein
MPYLMVNLDDPADCRRALQQLRRRAHAGPGCQPPGRGQAAGHGRPDAGVAGLPLGQKLRRIRQRGVWRHLLQIARLDEQPRSLNEWDEAIGLQPNKMRSLKAIMAKLEHRFGLRFLAASADTGVDAAGNPRYAMPPRVRTVILRIAEQESDA